MYLDRVSQLLNNKKRYVFEMGKSLCLAIEVILKSAILKANYNNNSNGYLLRFATSQQNNARCKFTYVSKNK